MEQPPGHSLFITLLSSNINSYFVTLFNLNLNLNLIPYSQLINSLVQQKTLFCSVKFQQPSLRLLQLNSHFLFKLLCGCWLVTKLICYKLWLASRFFPLVPVHNELQLVPPMLHTLLFAVSLVCMLLVWIFPNRRVAIILLVSELLSCMLDQNR